MIKLYHISDTHLSFDNTYTIKKPMDQRSWSKHSQNYVGYLEAIQDMGKNEITNQDFVVITGDIVHDMKQKDIIYNLNWLRQCINGTIIIIKGNHDYNMDLAYLRTVFTGNRLYMVGEGETISIGPYTFGCWSDHKAQDKGGNEQDYIDFSHRLKEQADRDKRTPVLLSHYPVNEPTAKKIGEIGIKAFLSGHIHCTGGSTEEERDENGNNWTWYDIRVKFSNDNTINGCYFSTGTTDVNRVLLKGKMFKHIECLDSDIMTSKAHNSLRSRAANAFGVSAKMVSPFSRKDTFNNNNIITGFICRKKGPMQGSLYITHVNGVYFEPQLIFGTPKLEYPYLDQSTRDYKDFSGCDIAILSEKLNGMNVLFYKYFDAYGNMYLTAKSKGTPFLTNTEFGNFLDLTKEVLQFEGNSLLEDLHPHLMHLLQEDIQSISFELFGKKEPHLVNYDVDINLVPLFVTYYDGRIRPDSTAFIDQIDLAKNSIEEVCKAQQQLDFDTNEAYRLKNGLTIKYEYDHFETEGKVLYAMDKDGFLIDRTMYKIKPKDIEEVHWQTFDRDMQQRVVEAVKKIKLNEENICESSLKQELDMGEKEWNKWGRQVMRLLEIKENGEVHNKVMILCGLPGSGKSTFAKELESKGWVRVNQDELGSRKTCKKVMSEALKDGFNVVVDRCNFDINQRKAWIDLAAKHGITNVSCLWLDIDKETCCERVSKRENHPTIKPDSDGEKIIDQFSRIFVGPELSEGFVNVTVLKDNNDLEKLMKEMENETV